MAERTIPPNLLDDKRPDDDDPNDNFQAQVTREQRAKARLEARPVGKTGIEIGGVTRPEDDPNDHIQAQLRERAAKRVIQDAITPADREAHYDTDAPSGLKPYLPTQPEGGTVAMFERLARDNNVDVEKLQRLIDMQKDILRHQAEGEFWAAFAEMQGDLPTIDEDGQIKVGDVIRSRYSTNEHIQEVIRPILKRHGFAISFRNTTHEGGLIKVTGILAHRSGHKETDSFDSLPDSGGSMNSIQRIGSTRSYGARYTTISLCNIVSRAKLDRDDDGKGAGKAPGPVPDPVEGVGTFAEWWETVSKSATRGQAAFDPAWGCSPPAFKNYALRADQDGVKALKATARAVGKAKP